jgi:methylase of polypeptide subunit release factors
MWILKYTYLKLWTLELGCGSGVVGLTMAAWLNYINSCDSSGSSGRANNSSSNSSCRVILTDLPVYLPAIEGEHLLPKVTIQ